MSACTAATVRQIILITMSGMLTAEQTNATGTILCRFFLGAIEAAFFSRINLLPFPLVYPERDGGRCHNFERWEFCSTGVRQVHCSRSIK